MRSRKRVRAKGVSQKVNSVRLDSVKVERAARRELGATAAGHGLITGDWPSISC